MAMLKVVLVLVVVLGAEGAFSRATWCWKKGDCSQFGDAEAVCQNSESDFAFMHGVCRCGTGYRHPSVGGTTAPLCTPEGRTDGEVSWAMAVVWSSFSGELGKVVAELERVLGVALGEPKLHTNDGWPLVAVGATLKTTVKDLLRISAMPHEELAKDPVLAAFGNLTRIDFTVSEDGLCESRSASLASGNPCDGLACDVALNTYFEVCAPSPNITFPPFPNTTFPPFTFPPFLNITLPPFTSLSPSRFTFNFTLPPPRGSAGSCAVSFLAFGLVLLSVL